MFLLSFDYIIENISEYQKDRFFTTQYYHFDQKITQNICSAPMEIITDFVSFQQGDNPEMTKMGF